MSRRNKSTPKGGQQNIATTDAFSNPLFRLGYGSQSPVEATEYPLTRMTDNYALLNSLYRDNWVVQNVVGLMVDDMLREWYKLRGTVSPEHQAELSRVERITQLRAKLNEGLRWGRLYGGAAGIILIKGQEGMLDHPLELDSIMPGAFAGLMVLDRWMGIVPQMGLVQDMGDPDFGLPEYYTINDTAGRVVATVHHSRVVRFTGRDLPEIERIAEVYWGESEVEALYKDVVAHDNVSANMTALTFQANVNTMEVQNLEQLFSLGSTEQQRRFWKVMQAQSVMRSNFGMQLVNKGDQITNHQYTFTGLQEVFESMCLNLCGASHYPMTKLFGRSPAGMNATGESDLKNYYDYVDSQREAKLRPALERLLPIMAMSAWGAIPDDLQIDFPPLWTPTAKEMADISKAKAEAIISVFQAGLIRADSAQKELKKLAEESGMFGNITDDEIAANAGKTYQDVTALRDPLAGLSFETPERETGGEATSPFESAAQDAASYTEDKSGRYIQLPNGKMNGSRPSGLTNGGESGNIQSSGKPEWGDKQAKEPFNYWEMAEDKNSFPIKWKPTGFSPSTLDDHYSRHGGSIEATSKEEYAAKAKAFLTSPRGKHGDAYVSKDGRIGRYDYDTHEFAIAYSDGTIATYWKLTDTKSASAADAYWEGDKKQYGTV